MAETETETEAHGKRPNSITGVCFVGLLGLAASVLLFASGALSNTPGWYPPVFAVSVVIGAACMFGYWTMRKWGVFLYSGFLVVNQIILLATGTWSPTTLLLPFVVVVIGYLNLDRMR